MDNDQHIKLLNIYLAIESSRTLDELLKTLSHKITLYFSADRTSLYVFDKNENCLFSKVAEGLGSQTIKVKVGQGIAGHVAQTRQPLISNNVYECPFFDPKFDILYNYTTKKVLCMPLINLQNELAGVIQILNKIDSDFNDDDIEKLNNLTTVTAVAVDNAKLFQELTELKEYNENIVNTVNISIVVIDKSNKIKSYNSYYEQSLLKNGWAVSDENIIKSLYFMDNLLSYINEARIKGFTAINELNCWINGRQYYFNIQLKKIINTDDYILILIDNVTELISLKKSEHLAIVGKFASSIIHDIKSPMSLISGYAQLINSTADSKKLKDYSAIIIDEISRLVSMSKEILDFSRGEIILNASPVRLSIFFNSLEPHLSQIFSDKYIIKINILDDNFVNIDTDRFKRVVINIANNAREAMPKGGNFNIQVKKENNSALSISFSDTGVGIPENKLTAIFEPFVSYNKKNGTGLGMAIVKKVVEEHNGNITVTSIEGKGTTFKIILPIFS